MISRWFGKERGTALALQFSGANLAAVVSPLVATVLITRVGWQDTLYVFALPALAFAVLVLARLPGERLAVPAAAGGGRYEAATREGDPSPCLKPGAVRVQVRIFRTATPQN